MNIEQTTKKIFMAMLLLFFVVGNSNAVWAKKVKFEKLPKTPESGLPKREFRGAWVATVLNIDWPSKDVSVQQQQQDLIALLDKLKNQGINAVFFQVRPSADAFYPSSKEPWSSYLTGKQGVKPQIPWDPVAFCIEECHKRYMEFHAWINPFRAQMYANEELAPNHILRKHPDWRIHYGPKYIMDPANPNVRNWICEVIRELVQNYDLDAIHFDDYFYPYPNGAKVNDEESFRKFHRGFSASEKADWRRDNVNLFVEQAYRTIKEVKPWVKFGISPFGVWRNKKDDPKGSNTSGGLRCYDELYADVKLWMEKGWLDYVVPQIYWRVGHPQVDFTTLSQWWGDMAKERNMYVGLALYKENDDKMPEAWHSGTEIPRQVNTLRNVDHVQGMAFFSASHFDRNLKGVQKVLKKDLMSNQALLPTMPWIDNKAPLAPHNICIAKTKKGYWIKWEHYPSSEMDKAKYYIVYRYFEGDNPSTLSTDHIAQISSKNTFYIPKKIYKKYRKHMCVRITALDRLNNESKPTGAISIE